MAKRVAKIGVPLVALVVAWVVTWRALAREQVEQARYRTQTVDRGDVVERVTAVGQLQALVQVDVGSQVSGRILKLHADHNTLVHRGDLLAELDPATFQAAVGQARAAVAAARAKLASDTATVLLGEQNLRRAQQLEQERIGTQADLDQARATLEAARAAVTGDHAQIAQSSEALRLAQASLAYTRIEAPIDGVVIARNVNVGQTVAASLQSPVLYVLAQDLERMQVLANIDEADVGRLREGMRARFTVDAFPDESFQGAITQIRYNPVTVENVVTYVAVIEVANAERRLRPGMTATVEVVTHERHGVIRIPNAALRYRSRPDPQGGAAPTEPPPPPGPGRIGRVTVLHGGRTRPVLVRLGATDGRRTELLSGGVAVGDRVVTETIESGGMARRFKIF